MCVRPITPEYNQTSYLVIIYSQEARLSYLNDIYIVMAARIHIAFFLISIASNAAASSQTLSNNLFLAQLSFLIYIMILWIKMRDW